MTFIWTPDMIRFMQDAAEYGNYYETFASVIAKSLDKTMRICDAGCGLGYLSLALALYCKEVTAIDCEEKAIDVLRKNVIEKNIGNVVPVLDDFFSQKPKELFDGMVCCFFGHIERILSAVTHQSTPDGRLFLIQKGWQNHRFSKNHEPLTRFTLKNAEEYLRTHDVPYSIEMVLCEMGQPFRSLSDAARFFQMYDKGTGERIDEQEVKCSLTQTNNQAFPFFYSSLCQVGIIQISVSAIPKE